LLLFNTCDNFKLYLMYVNYRIVRLTAITSVKHDLTSMPQIHIKNIIWVNIHFFVPTHVHSCD
jgi:hypothetical protein